ncbi:hypothetical protein CEXT_440111 [Caerostris extrusa]|uniref:Uncharacterized protein n=1 Tax=Caerostris extrusa TaxID=172846 RepID=A0AAV4UGH6_CAEEX|nr:hypothetical protein CEXT_440111 [Caerostris extrusa]
MTIPDDLITCVKGLQRRRFKRVEWITNFIFLGFLCRAQDISVLQERPEVRLEDIVLHGYDSFQTPPNGEETVLTFLEKDDIPTEDFRAQSYDNASNISGKSKRNMRHSELIPSTCCVFMLVSVYNRQQVIFK